jgi:hypothetical protein
MEPTITPEQEAQLKTWASERDTVLSEIAVLKNQKDIITKYNQDAAESYTEMITKIQQSIGRMVELDLKEKDWEVIMSNEVADLRTEKTKLETQLTNFKTEVAVYESKKETLVKDIELLLVLYNQHYGHAQNLDKVVDRVVRISQENMDKLNIFVKSLEPEVQKLLDLVQINIGNTNLVIDKLPRMVVELQKHGLIKKL